MKGQNEVTTSTHLYLACLAIKCMSEEEAERRESGANRLGSRVLA